MHRTRYAAQSFGISLIITLTVWAMPCLAQAWPQRVVHLIVPLSPGTGTDFAARLFADRLAERWGRPVVVENRPGGDGIVAITGFISAGDDHSLLFSTTGPITVNPVVHEKLPYDPVHDLVPISSANFVLVAIAATESLKVGSLSELVVLAHAQPGKLNYAATPGITDFTLAGFMKSANLSIAKVSYRNITQALQDLSEGRVQIMMSALTILLPQVHAGKIRMLAVTNGQRAPIMPDVPTVVEAGYPELAGMESPIGFYGLRDMPNELRERIAADIRAVATDPAIAVRLAATGQVLRTSTPAEFAAALQDQREKITAIVQTLGIKPTQ